MGTTPQSVQIAALFGNSASLWLWKWFCFFARKAVQIGSSGCDRHTFITHVFLCTSLYCASFTVSRSVLLGSSLTEDCQDLPGWRMVRLQPAQLDVCHGVSLSIAVFLFISTNFPFLFSLIGNIYQNLLSEDFFFSPDLNLSDVVYSSYECWV